MQNYSPLRYPGGKNKTYNYIKHIVKDNNIKTYIEPFCGGAAVALKLLINKDVERIFLNDYDKSIYALWFSIINYPDELIKKIQDTPITIQEWERQKELQKNKENLDLFSLGFSTLFLNRTNHSGILKSGPIGGINQSGKFKIDCRFNKTSIIQKIRIIANHKGKIKLYNKDAIDFTKQNIIRTKNSLTFYDPPYYKKGKDLYINFYTHEDHLDLNKNIRMYMEKHNWILTYDSHDEILKMYNEFEYFNYQLNYSAGTVKTGNEFIFLSNKLSSAGIEKHLKILDK